MTASRTATTTDALLLERIAAHNDYRAFEVLFHKYYNNLARYAFSLTQAKDVAEEIANDVFLKIWRNREVLHIKSSVHAYLVTATRNLAIDHLRRTIRRRGRSVELVGDFEAVGHASPIDRYIGIETSDIIEAAIEALPRQGRLIFRMSRDNNMTYTEIAQTLNLSIKTVETHMGRSLKYLREAMKREVVV
jgi:RNA polymerase sigma-70 factor, ECF subfamily